MTTKKSETAAATERSSPDYDDEETGEGYSPLGPFSSMLMRIQTEDGEAFTMDLCHVPDPRRVRTVIRAALAAAKERDAASGKDSKTRVIALPWSVGEEVRDFGPEAFSFYFDQWHRVEAAIDARFDREGTAPNVVASVDATTTGILLLEAARLIDKGSAPPPPKAPKKNPVKEGSTMHVDLATGAKLPRFMCTPGDA